MQFANKLTKGDLSEVRKMTRSKTYWLNLSLWGATMLYATPRAWTVTMMYLAHNPSNWRLVAVVWTAVAGIILYALYNQEQIRERQLGQLNASRPDEISLINDGVKYDGPNGSKSLFPWSNFRGWREGRRVILLERREGNKFVILPVGDLSESERMPIRNFLQSNVTRLTA